MVIKGAKFETFPVWNLPLKHPVNIAYEAATADLNDVNMIDPFHLDIGTGIEGIGDAAAGTLSLLHPLCAPGIPFQGLS